ncbi:hypothetical protein R1flu_026017 [Riccia fluitans]|uniref:Uncharacterized protein n=1 Tax=Riccia fluitans TaxID=41844 RepID=A0ABD1XER9_9MARC
MELSSGDLETRLMGENIEPRLMNILHESHRGLTASPEHELLGTVQPLPTAPTVLTRRASVWCTNTVFEVPVHGTRQALVGSLLRFIFYEKTMPAVYGVYLQVTDRITDACRLISCECASSLDVVWIVCFDIKRLTSMGWPKLDEVSVYPPCSTAMCPT